MRERKRCEEMRGMRVQGTVPGTVPPGGVLPAKGRRVAREASEVARRGGSRKGALRLFGPAGRASGRRNTHAPVPPSPTRMSLKLGTPVARGAAQALSKPAFAHNCCSLARGNAPAGTFMPGRAILRATRHCIPEGTDRGPAQDFAGESRLTPHALFGARLRASRALLLAVAACIPPALSLLR